MRVSIPSVLACSLILAVSCATTEQETKQERVTTLAQARQDYLAGLQSLKDGEYAAAVERLQKVARGPSYIVYSPLARLRLADALYFQEKFEEASEAYRGFMETSAGDPNLHYAAFMMAQAKVRSMPAEFLLVPPADRRDQRRVRSAMGTLVEFVTHFPDSPFAEDGLALLRKMTGIVISYEMEVAHFYMTREKPVGAVNRLKRLVADVPPAARNEDARAALIEALAAAGNVEDLRKECDAYRERFPGGKHQKQVTGWCASSNQQADAK